jgi:DNA-binding response OmpR family regulator
MKKRILVVDDDESVRESLKRVLKGAGYEVVLAGGGLEAAIRFEPGRIDLLLLDLNLPNQSGWDVFERLTTQYPFVPVIIITGLPNQQGTARAAGVGALFEKPVEVTALLQRIEELLAEPAKVRLERLCGHREDTQYVRAKEAQAGGPRSERFRRAANQPTTLRNGGQQ